MSLPEHSLEKAHKIDEDSGSMVRAILEGHKTQTRRIVKQSRGLEKHSICRPDMAAYSWSVWWHYPETDHVGHLVTCPYGKPEDQLWVRESFYLASACAHEVGIGFRADHPTGNIAQGDGGYNFHSFSSDPFEAKQQRVWADTHTGTERWLPSIHMPRWASRITLEITSVRVERVQNISEEDARAEGVERDHEGWKDYSGGESCVAYATTSFSSLWDSINAKRGFGWDKNPWVWVIDFKRVDAKQDKAA